MIARVFNVADGRDSAGDEVRRRFGVDDRLLLLGTGEIVQQDESGVFLLTQDSEGPEAGGFRAKQEWCGAYQVALDDRDVDR